MLLMTTNFKNKESVLYSQPIFLKLLVVFSLFVMTNKLSFSLDNSTKNTISASLKFNDTIIDIDINSISNIQLSKADYNFMIGDKKDWKFGLKKIDKIKLNDHLNNQIFEIKNTYINPNLLFNSKLNVTYSDDLKNKNKPSIQNTKINQLQNSEPISYENVIFSTYFGGADFDYPTSTTIDKDSNIYVVGYTSSKNLPTTNGSYKKDSRISNFGESDVFISKFDKFGNLVTCTYFGSFVDDRATDIKINKNDEVVIIGYVHQTTTFPFTMNVYDSTANGFYDCFISKFDKNLTNLLASTLLGGRKDDYPMSLDIDDQNFIYLTGYTTEIQDSIPFPTTQIAYDRTYKGGYDVFVSKLSPDLAVLTNSTLYGGNMDDFAQDIKVTPSGSIVVTGFTKSNTLPVTGDAIQYKYNDSIGDSSKSDIFILKLGQNFDVLLYSSYFGGIGRDGAYSVETDINENYYITGFTESSDFPITIGSYAELNGFNAARQNNGDSFVMKLENSGRNLVYSTTFGGDANERSYDLKLNEKNEVISIGYTNSSDFPISLNSFDKQIVNENNSDGFIYKLSEDGSQVLFSSYFGGEDNDICKSLVYFGNDTKNDLIALVGSTTSKNFIISEFGFDKEYNDTTKTDAFISLLKVVDNPIINYDYTICSGQSVLIESDLLDSLDLINNTYTYRWIPSNFLDSDNISMPTSTPDGNIFYEFIITDQNNIELRDTIYIRVVNPPNPIIAGNVVSAKFQNGSFSVNRSLKSSYLWFVQNATILNGQGTHILEVTFNNADTARIYVIETNSFGCSDTSDVFEVLLYDIGKPKVMIASGTIPRCLLDTLVLDAGPFFNNVVWSNGVEGRFLRVMSAGKFSFKASNLIGEIVFSDTVNVTTIQSPTKPQIRLTGMEYRCLTTAKSYQWYYEGALIPGATDRRYTATQWGFHQVRISAENGCFAFSDELTTDIENNEDNSIKDNSIIINYYNENLNIRFKNDILSNNSNFSFTLYDLIGNEIDFKQKLTIGEIDNQEVNIPLNLNNGVYLINFIIENNIYNYKFIVF